MAKIQRSYYIEADLAKWLKVASAEWGLSASALLEKALWDYRKSRRPEPTEAERRAMEYDIRGQLE